MASKKAQHLADGAVRTFADYLNRFLNDFKKAVRQDNNQAMTMTAVGLSQIGVVMEEFFSNVESLGITSEEDENLADKVASSLDNAIRADLLEVASTAPAEDSSPKALSDEVPEDAPTERDISQLN